jgi:transitional endoplasmic reticulum ATPase
MSTDERTLSLLRRMVEASPADWSAREHLAGLLLDADRAKEAVELLDAAPARPEGAEADLLLGRALSKADPSRAVRHYQAMVAKDRRSAPAHIALARLFRDAGRKEDARHHYGIAVVLDQTLEDPSFDDWIHGASVPAGPSAAPPPPEEVPSAEDLEAALSLERREKGGLPRITFDDVGGMHEVKEQIRMRVVYPFKNPETFARFKRKAGGGLLLYGPPGCGKTYLARATAGECGARFTSVGISDILARWLGESEQRLAEVFENARRLAPTILFFDELDALGMDRRDAHGGGIRPVINQLLTEMDGVAASNENVLILGATNAPWNVDAAFRRPGRFDRVIFIPPPDAAARAAILRLHLKDVPHDAPDYERLAKATKRFSGADLRSVVERASEAAIQEEMRTGRPGRISEKMLLKAVQASKPSTLEWLETARRYASYSNRAGQYDDVARFFESDAS